MTATILSFGRRQPNTPPLPAKMPWQNQDLAELYRVRDRLCAAGLDVEVEAGVTDEGDPWFVYVQAGTDNVVVHIARIDSEIHVINCVTGGTYTGTSFREVSDRMLEDAPLALSTQVRRGSNVVLHPSAFLTAFVAAAIMLIDLLEHGRAEAATHHDDATDAGHHGNWVVTTGASQDEAAHQSSQSLVAGDEPTGEADGLHRRLGKESPVSVQTVSGLASIPGLAALPGTSFSLSTSHGFLAEIPGVSASVTLAAGLLAAEFARSFAGEITHSAPEGAGMAQGFVSLLKAFVAVEPAYAKAPVSMETPIAVTLAPSDAVALTTHSEGNTAHHVVVADVGTLNAAVSVKPVADSWTEHALFATAEAHKPSTMTATPSFTPPAAQAPAAAQDAQRPAPSPPPAVEATSSVPIGAAQPVTSSAPATTKADATKDGSAPDLGWVVSQLVKHSGLTTDMVQRPSSLSESSEAKSKSSSTDNVGEKTTAGTSLDTTDGDAVTQKAKPQASSETVKPTEEHHTVTKPAEPTYVLVKDGLATLQAGLHETVHYLAGTSLTVKGFVLGEDHVAFDGALGDAMAKSARADGYDLLLGDADTGMMRLVGVLADPSLPHAQDGRPTAA